MRSTDIIALELLPIMEFCITPSAVSSFVPGISCPMGVIAA